MKHTQESQAEGDLSASRTRAPMDEVPQPARTDLGVTHVLVGELPPTIGTMEEPERYDVSAVFTRRPSSAELRLLAAPAVASRLHDSGYAQATLEAVDRRLVIGHTNLAELTAGLAALIGEILLEVGAEADRQQRERDAESTERARDEAARAAIVLEAASRVDFRAHPSMYV
ncbi:hypothetical protein [Agromyces marinus]|nr:hypothetical protein [Agromyces marinus]